MIEVINPTEHLCIFDELSIGLAPILVDELLGTIERIRNGGITVLLIE